MSDSAIALIPVIVAFVSGLLLAIPGILTAVNQGKRDKQDREQEINNRIMKYTDTVERRLQYLEGSVIEKDKRLEDLTAKNDELDGRLTDANSRISMLQGELGARDQQIAQLVSENSQLKSKLDLIQNQVNRIRRDTGELKKSRS